MPRPRKQLPLNADILAMALTCFEAAKAKIEIQITAIKKALGATSRSHTKNTAVKGEVPNPKRRKLSATARQRIAAAQKKRWAAVRAANKG